MALNVLIVDDSDVIRAMITRTLGLSGIALGRVLEAGNGREALQVLDTEWIDVVLADLNMPVMDGEQMIKHMRRNPATAGVPVIVVSTEGALQRVERLLSTGVCAWVRKPFTPEQIRDAIRQLVDTLPAAEETRAHIDAVIIPALETFAFASAEPVETLTSVHDVDVMVATIAFNGAANGALAVAAPQSLCAELAANVIGAEPDDPDIVHNGADALGEIANIAAGHVATLIDADIPSQLLPPVVRRAQPGEWMRLTEGPGTRCYLVDGEPMVISLHTRPSVRSDG